MPAFAPLLRADLLLRAALVVGGGLRAPRCTRAAPNGVFVRAFMVAKRRGKLEMGSIEAEVIRTSYWVSAVQGADVHGAGQQQREPWSAASTRATRDRQQPPQKALRHHTFGRGIFGSRSFFVSGSRPKWKGAVRGNVTPASDEETLGRSCLPGGHFLSPAGRAGGAAGAGACRRREGPRRGSAARPGSPPRHQSPFYRVRAPATTHSRPRACLCQTSRTPNGPTPPFPPSS